MQAFLCSAATLFLLAIVPLASADSAQSFDRAAASKALSGVSLGRCKVPNGPKGPGHVKITFAADGSVRSAIVDQGPYLKSPPVSRCIAGNYQKVRIPSYSGPPVTVGKAFTID